MKILYLAPETTIYLNMSGGAGTHMRGTVDYLKKNHDVLTMIGGDILNPIDKETKNREILKNNSLSIKGLIKSVIPKAILNLKQDFRRLQHNRFINSFLENKIDKNDLPDVIYERSGYGFNTGLFLSKKYRIPLVLESDVTILELVRPSSTLIFNRWIFRVMESKKMKHANSIVVMSIPSIGLLKKIWNIKHDRVYFKGLGISVQNFHMKKNINIRDKYNLQKKFVVGYVGIFQDYQNIPIIFDVAEILKEQREIVFLIIGTGARINEYKKYVKSRNLQNIIFTGHINKDIIENYYEAIDVGLITDNANHMYPVKFLEFINYKKITLVPRYDAFRIFYENDQVYYKYSFKSKDHHDLSTKINEVYNDRIYYESHLKYTREVVLRDYTWNECSKRLEGILINIFK